MTDFVVALKISGDGSGAAAAAKEVRAEIIGVGDAAAQAGAASATGFEQAEESLASIGATAEAAVARVGATTDALRAQFDAWQAEAAVVQEFMASEAESLDAVIERRIAYNDALQVGILSQEEFEAATAALAKQEAALIASSERYAQQMETLALKYAGASAAAEKLTADEERLNAALASGIISAERHAAAIEGINAQRAGLQAEAAAAQGVASAMEQVSFQSAGARREIGVLVGEGVRGNVARLEGSVVTLANRTGLLSLAFTPIGGLVLAVAAALGVAGTAFIRSAHEQDDFNRALISTGQYAGTSAEQLLHQADAIGASTGRYGDAEKAVQSLAASGRVLSSDLGVVAQGAVDLSVVTGQSIEKSVKDFEKLADSPVKAVEELNKQYHFLTPAILDQIAAQERAGDADGAAATAQRAFAAALAQRAAEVEKSLSGITQWWHNVQAGAHSAWQAMLNVGDNSVDAQIDDILKKIMQQQDALANLQRIGEGNSNDAQNRRIVIQQLTEQYNALNKTAQAQRTANAAADAAADADHKAADAALATSEAANKLADSMKKRADSASLSNVQQVQEAINERVAAQAAVDHKTSIDDLRASVEKEFEPAMKSAQAADANAASKKAAAEAARLWAQDENTLQEVLRSAEKEVQKGLGLADQLAESIGGPLASAQKKYDDEIAQFGKTFEALNTELSNGTISQQKYDQQLDAVIDGTDNATKAFERQKEAIHARLDVGDALLAKLHDELEAQRAGTDAERAWQLVEKASEEALAHMTDLYGKAEPTREKAIEDINAEKAALAGHVQALLNDSDALKANQAVMKDWANITESEVGTVFQDINKDILEGGSVMKDLVNVAKQTTEAIFYEFEKLLIINPLLKSIFGTGVVGNLPDGSNIGGWLGGLFGNGTSGAGGGGLFGGGGSGSILNLIGGNGSSLFNTVGGWLGLGGAGGASLAGNVAAGGIDLSAAAGAGAPLFDASGATLAGNSALGGVDLSAGAGAGGGGFGLGNAAPVLGGALAGWQIGSQLGGTAGGVLGAAGLATAAYFIPVIGWIAGIASLVNSLTGGDVFGTPYKPTGVTGTNISIGPNGATAEDFYQEHKHGALFSSGHYKNVDVPTPQDQQDGLNQFFDSLKEEIKHDADLLGTQSGDIIGGTFQQVTDKTGKVISQQSEVLGQKYTEDATHFQERVEAVNEEALLPVSDQLTAFFKQFDSNADRLKDAADMMLAAQIDINRGMGLLGDADKSVVDVGNTVKDYQQGNETLSQTYARLQGETQDLKSTLTELGLTVNKDGADFVQFADSMTQAAGGLNNLDSLWASYYQNYYSDSERSAQAMSTLQKNSADSLHAIGEDGVTSMAQFRADFERELPNLTPEQVVEWLKAGDALAKYTDALKAQQQAIDQADQAFVQNFAQLVQSTQTLAAQLFGSATDQIKQKIADLQAKSAAFTASTGLIDYNANAQIAQLQSQLTQQEQAQITQQNLMGATQLVADFGKIGAVSGETLEQLATQFNVPLDKLEQYLGTDEAGADKMYDQQVQAAKAAAETALNTKYGAELLADILAEEQGRPDPYSADDLLSAKTGLTIASTTGDTKPGSGTNHFGRPPNTATTDTGSPAITPAQVISGSGSGDHLTRAVSSGNKDTVSAIQAGNALLQRIADALDNKTGQVQSLQRTGREASWSRR